MQNSYKNTYCISENCKRENLVLHETIGYFENIFTMVTGFHSKTPTLRGPERLCQTPPCNAKRARLAAFDRIGNMFSLTYSQMIAQQFRQLNGFCRHLYFMKTGHAINCCVF